jgi:hypothetical protein
MAEISGELTTSIHGQFATSPRVVGTIRVSRAGLACPTRRRTCDCRAHDILTRIHSTSRATATARPTPVMLHAGLPDRRGQDARDAKIQGWRRRWWSEVTSRVPEKAFMARPVQSGDRRTSRPRRGDLARLIQSGDLRTSRVRTPGNRYSLEGAMASKENFEEDTIPASTSEFELPQHASQDRSGWP